MSSSVIGELRFNNVTESREQEESKEGGRVDINSVSIWFNGANTIQVRPLVVQQEPASSTRGQDAPHREASGIIFYFLEPSLLFTFCHDSALAYMDPRVWP